MKAQYIQLTITSWNGLCTVFIKSYFSISDVMVTGCHLSFWIGCQSQEGGSYLMWPCQRADAREARLEEEQTAVGTVDDVETDGRWMITLILEPFDQYKYPSCRDSDEVWRSSEITKKEDKQHSTNGSSVMYPIELCVCVL